MKEKTLLATVSLAIAIGAQYSGSGAASAQQVGCSASTRNLGLACRFDARDELLTRIAQCQDAGVVDDACIEAAKEEYSESLDECGEVRAARAELCEVFDDAVHEPMFGAGFEASFIDPGTIGGAAAPNPYFPLVVGNQWVYEGPEETITVTVTEKTKLIDGINCVVVNDIVVDEDGIVIENTDDWYAQDLDGNVWYCGEIAENYELFDGDDPEVAELTDIDGSWKHGRDRAKAGMLLPFAPVVGDWIRQELLFTDAEDAIEILSVTASETAPAGACVETCLQTRDFTPLEPGVNEHKFYAPGIGMIVEINLEDDERVELVEFTGVGS
jgi:hypothetical protein